MNYSKEFESWYNQQTEKHNYFVYSKDEFSQLFEAGRTDEVKNMDLIVSHSADGWGYRAGFQYKQAELIAKEYSALLKNEIHPPSFEAMVNTQNMDNLEGTEQAGEQIYIGFELAQEIRERAFKKIVGRELNEDNNEDYDLYFLAWEIARKNLYYSEATMTPDEIRADEAE